MLPEGIMGDTYLRVLSYNTHLFGDSVSSWLADVFQGFQDKLLLCGDKERKDQLIRYLGQQPSLIDLFVLQEVWSSDYAADFRDKLDSFASHLSRNALGDDRFNKSGLWLQAIAGVTFTDKSHFNYDAQSGEKFHLQDANAHKGFLYATATLDSNFDRSDTAQHKHSIWRAGHAYVHESREPSQDHDRGLPGFEQQVRRLRQPDTSRVAPLRLEHA